MDHAPDPPCQPRRTPDRRGRRAVSDRLLHLLDAKTLRPLDPPSSAGLPTGALADDGRRVQPGRLDVWSRSWAVSLVRRRDTCGRHPGLRLDARILGQAAGGRPLPLDEGLGVRRAVARRQAALHRHPHRPRPRPANGWRPHPVRARSHPVRGGPRGQPRRTTPGPGPRRPRHRCRPPRRRYRAGPAHAAPRLSDVRCPVQQRWTAGADRHLRPISVAVWDTRTGSRITQLRPPHRRARARWTWPASGTGSSARSTRACTTGTSTAAAATSAGRR